MVHIYLLDSFYLLIFVLSSKDYVKRMSSLKYHVFLIKTVPLIVTMYTNIWKRYFKHGRTSPKHIMYSRTKIIIKTQHIYKIILCRLSKHHNSSYCPYKENRGNYNSQRNLNRSKYKGITKYLIILLILIIKQCLYYELLKETLNQRENESDILCG